MCKDGSTDVLDSKGWSMLMQKSGQNFTRIAAMQSFIYPKGGYNTGLETTYKFQPDYVNAMCVTHRLIPQEDFNDPDIGDGGNKLYNSISMSSSAPQNSINRSTHYLCKKLTSS